jgi:hypothetical protein
VNPYNGFMAPEPWDGEEWARDQIWKGPQSWLDIVFEGEWCVERKRIQREIGPEYDMHAHGREPEDG